MKKVIIVLILFFGFIFALSVQAAPQIPAAFFYKTPQSFCSIRYGNQTKAEPTDDQELYGTGECQSSEVSCMRSGWDYVGGVVEKTGQKVKNYVNPVAWDQGYTGDSIFCSADGIPTPIGCWQPYGEDKDPGGDYSTTTIATWPKGNYCGNSGNANGKEKDNKCASGNSRADVGFEAISSALENINVVEITEGSLDEWMDNNVFDPDGNRAKFRNLASNIHAEDNGRLLKDMLAQGITTKSAVPKQSWERLKEIKARYLDNGNPVLMGMTIQGLGGHSVILTRAEINSEDATLTIVDSNSNQNAGPTTFSCNRRPMEDNAEYECSSNIYDGYSIYIEDFDFDSAITDSLLSANTAYCKSHSKGNLCARRGQFNTWVESHSSAMGPNYSTTRAGGTCYGWSDTLLRIAYLANFVGENPAVPAMGCASDLAGESNTYWCYYNQSACKLSVVYEFYDIDPLGRNGTVKASAEGELDGFCAHKSQPAWVGGPMLSDIARVVPKLACDGAKVLVFYGGPDPKSAVPYGIYYRLESSGTAAK
ncbi:MAG: hypothetical protein NTY66_00595, partial [Candidatus Vogelbacteria bacterium]|nr:hypothetical protein [Candidatus Vogelbacteria bacterium]